MKTLFLDVYCLRGVKEGDNTEYKGEVDIYL